MKKNQLVTVYVVAGPDHGKTTAAALLYYRQHLSYRLDGRSRVVAAPRLDKMGDELMRQLILILKTGKPDKSDPNRVEDAIWKNFAPGVDLKIVCTPGEALREADGSVDTVQLCGRFAVRNSVLVAVVNPFRLDPDLAFRSWLALTATLQRESLGYPLLKALLMAAEMLFGITEAELTQMPNFRTIQRTKSGRIEYKPMPELGADSYQVVDLVGRDGTMPVTTDRLLKALRRMAEIICDGDQDIPAIRELIRTHAAPVVALSRGDLMSLLPGITSSDLDAVYDSLFGATDRRASQEVRLKHHKFVIEPHDNSTAYTKCYHDGLLPEAGQSLQKAIELQLPVVLRKDLRQWQIAAGISAATALACVLTSGLSTVAWAGATLGGLGLNAYLQRRTAVRGKKLSGPSAHAAAPAAAKKQEAETQPAEPHNRLNGMHVPELTA